MTEEDLDNFITIQDSIADYFYYYYSELYSII